MKIEYNKNLKKLNTFNIESFCNEFIIIENIKDFSKLKLKEDSFILGGGSNVIFSRKIDQVIHPKINEIEKIDRNKKKILIKAGAGIIWDDFVKYCVNNEYYGIENLSYIPGTIGASPVQNIGAYGIEVSSLIKNVEFYNIETKKFEHIENKDCLFGYRDSIFKHKLKSKAIVTNVTFELSNTPNFNIEYGEIKQKLQNQQLTLQNIRNTIIEIRKNKLHDPEEYGNAGSFFKNAIVNESKLCELKAKFPDMKYFKAPGGFKIPTAWLIEKSGLKGLKMGNVGVSPKHSLIIINYGNATADEILNLDSYIKQRIMEKIGIAISEEVIII